MPSLNEESILKIRAVADMSGLNKAKSEIGKFNGAVDSAGAGQGRLARLSTQSQLAIAGVGFAAAGAGVAALKSSIEFESAFAGVKKTVNASDKELMKLRATILSMSSDRSNPVAGLDNAAVELAGIMESAGQLGVEGSANLQKFTETVAMLGMATNLTTESAASELARFANITNLPLDQIDRLGSTVVHLGNNMATTESEIVAMAQRLAAAGESAGLTEQNTLALAGAMSSVGLQAEGGGTAMSTVMKKIAKAVAKGGSDLKTFAKVSGWTSEQFAQGWQGEPITAIEDFIIGLGELDNAARLETLSELGLEGIRVSDTLGRLANNTNILTDAIGMSNDAWEENIALTNEAGQRFETTEAKVNLLENQAKNLSVQLGDELSPTLNTGLDIASMSLNIVDWVINGPEGGIEPPDPADFGIPAEGWTVDVGPISYEVQAGDTAQSIADELGIDVEVVKTFIRDEWNGTLLAGGTMTLEGPDVQVQPGVANFEAYDRALMEYEQVNDKLETQNERIARGLATTAQVLGLQPIVDTLAAGGLEGVGAAIGDKLSEIAGQFETDVISPAIAGLSLSVTNAILDFEISLTERANSLGAAAADAVNTIGEVFGQENVVGDGTVVALSPEAQERQREVREEEIIGTASGYFTNSRNRETGGASTGAVGASAGGEGSGSSAGGVGAEDAIPLTVGIEPESLEQAQAEIDAIVEAAYAPVMNVTQEGASAAGAEIDAIAGKIRTSTINVTVNTTQNPYGNIPGAAADPSNTPDAEREQGQGHGGKGYADGTAWTGDMGKDEVAGVVHGQEAVVPAKGMVVKPSRQGLMLSGGGNNQPTEIRNIIELDGNVIYDSVVNTQQKRGA